MDFTLLAPDCLSASFFSSSSTHSAQVLLQKIQRDHRRPPLDQYQTLSFLPLCLLRMYVCVSMYGCVIHRCVLSWGFSPTACLRAIICLDAP